jgi:two-component system sensor histidine kinase HydH
VNRFRCARRNWSRDAGDERASISNSGRRGERISPATNRSFAKIVIVADLMVVGVFFYYGWLIGPLDRNIDWLYGLHARVNYIPIVLAAAWFGLRGGLIVAGVITVLVLPHILGSELTTSGVVSEWTDIVFYFASAALVGYPVERELSTRAREHEAQLQLQESQKLSLVGQIAAGVAHEIKNPLASITGAADILADQTTSPAEHAEFSAILKNEVKRIDGTVSEFLEFARPKRTELHRLNLSDEIRTCLRQCDAQVRALGMTLATAIRDQVIVNGDPEKLHQMMLNLLLNAMHASSEGQSIDVSLERSGNSKAVLTIADSGEGIAANALEHIFEPFYTTKPSGTGLGLAVVKAIVDSHHGEIKIDSTPGVGTTVHIKLPLAEEEQVNENSPGR